MSNLNETPQNDLTRQGDAEQKKTYHTPELSDHGGFRDLTRFSPGVALDGGDDGNSTNDDAGTAIP